MLDRVLQNKTNLEKITDQDLRVYQEKLSSSL
jgi:hypothetical protein